ncbi:MAG TPA: hypothetical protein VN647_04740 [Nitrospira sp.]|nr:hypothetical protein [Nitrospira sp.]
MISTFRIPLIDYPHQISTPLVPPINYPKPLLISVQPHPGPIPPVLTLNILRAMLSDVPEVL